MLNRTLTSIALQWYCGLYYLFTVPKFEISQSETVSTVQISRDIKSRPDMATISCSLDRIWVRWIPNPTLLVRFNGISGSFGLAIRFFWVVYVVYCKLWLDQHRLIYRGLIYRGLYRVYQNGAAPCPTGGNKDWWCSKKVRRFGYKYPRVNRFYALSCLSPGRSIDGYWRIVDTNWQNAGVP